MLDLNEIIEGLKYSLNDMCYIYGHPTRVKEVATNVNWLYEVIDVISGEVINYSLGVVDSSDVLIYGITSNKISESTPVRIVMCPKDESMKDII